MILHREGHYYGRRTVLREIENSSQRAAEIRPGTYTAKVVERDTGKVIAVADGLTIPENLAIIVYAVGSPRNSTFALAFLPTGGIPIN